MGRRTDLEQRVERALAEVRPGLVHDGGDVELVAIVDGIVRVRLLGACRDCPLAPDTVLPLITERVVLRAPEVRSVVFDHAG